MNFENKICVVTGGANGIGLCIGNEFGNYIIPDGKPPDDRDLSI
jgi:hypothetical protein